MSLKISVVTVCFNSASHIRISIESVLSQSHAEFEYIIVDGKSTDGTIKIIKEYEPLFNGRMKYVSEKDGGIYDAINKGISMSTGDIIGLLHSDDKFASKNTLKLISRGFIIPDVKGDEVDCVYGDLVYIKSNGSDKIVRYWKSESFHFGLIRKGWMPPHPTVFFRREVFDKFGFYNTNFRIAADYEFILRVFSDQRVKPVYIPEVITHMRVGGESNRSLKNVIRKSREDYNALKWNRIPRPLLVLFLKNVCKLGQFLHFGRPVQN